MRTHFIAIAGLWLAASNAHAVSVSNGGFESSVITMPYDYVFSGETTLTDWVVDGGSGVILGRSLWQPAEGDQSVELILGRSGGISQTIETVPGQVYRLEFEMAGNPLFRNDVKEMQVFWDGSLVSTQYFDVSGHSRSSMGWDHRTVLLPAATSEHTVLRFFGSVPAVVAGPDGGSAIDNVRLSLIPEPVSIAVVISACAALAHLRYRRPPC